MASSADHGGKGIMADGIDQTRSPPRRAATRDRERRNPSITPRKFQRFFTPRSRVPSRPSAARRALLELTAPALNRSQTPSSPLKPITEHEQGTEADSFCGHGPVKRRKIEFTSDLSPAGLPFPSCLASPLPHSLQINRTATVESGLLSPIQSLPSTQSTEAVAESEADHEDAEEVEELSGPLRRILTLSHRDLAAHVVQREAGSSTRNLQWNSAFPVGDCRQETANFYSSPVDVHTCTSLEGGRRAIPFCATSCNTNGLLAIGDEEGYVRLLDAAADPDVDFSKLHLSFQAHGNAVIDMAFSADDRRLATASGDQTGRVFDMMTQRPISLLGHHTASLKQVRFQPGISNGNVLASCGRDGTIQLWDLRCSGPVSEIPPIQATKSLEYRIPRQTSVGSVINLIYGAHAPKYRQVGTQASAVTATAAASLDVTSRSEVPGRIGEVSVTSLQFLNPGREHLLLSACEADASIRVWDIRSVHTSRHRTCEPTAFTRQPDSHTSWRPFGISSLSLSGDGARLYALCKDNTVYAYSTAHLMTGHAPELSSRSDAPRRKHGAAHEGLGPLYGFRHDMFHATSFYIKSALRPAHTGRSEMLAVGSNDNCAVLFPTDERYFKHAFARAEALDAVQNDGRTSLLAAANHHSTFSSSLLHGNRARTLHRTNSISNMSARLIDTIPIIRATGTALVRGHDREVGAVTWTHDGDLVTIGDDYHVRCWREDRAKAADLRTGGETDGRRWMSGWADVEPDWDEVEDEWE